MATKPKTKRPKNEVIKNTAATLLKQLSGYWVSLPGGELRQKVEGLMKDAEQLSKKTEAVFPRDREETYTLDEDAIRNGS